MTCLPVRNRETRVNSQVASPDGKQIAYFAFFQGGDEAAGGPPKQLTNFTADIIFAFDISRDGKQLALSRGTRSSDVVLISDFK